MGEIRQFGRKYRALIAESLATNRILLQEILKQEGCACVLVKDGDEALDAIEEGGFDLLVLEARLPREDGITVMKAYRSILANGSLTAVAAPVILTTDAAGPEAAHVIVAAQAAGAFRVLAKPFDFERVRIATREALRSEAAA